MDRQIRTETQEAQMKNLDIANEFWAITLREPGFERHAHTVAYMLDQAESRGRAEVQRELAEAVRLLRQVCGNLSLQGERHNAQRLVSAYDALAAAKKGG